MRMNSEEFAKWVLDVVSDGPWPEFKAGGWYNEAGLQVEYYHENVSYYGSWVDHFLTVYCDQKTDRLVGFNVYFDEKKPLYPSVVMDDQLFLDEYISLHAQNIKDAILQKYLDVIQLVKGVRVDLKKSE